MSIFPSLVVESTVQADDKTRLDGTKSFISSDEAAITLIRIDPETNSNWVTVTSDQYLDWAFSSAGSKTVTIEITTDGSPVTSTGTVLVVTSATDALFSTDAELIEHEGNVLDYVRAGRNSFIDKHRLAQDRILTWLDENRIWDTDGDKLTKAAILNNEEVNDWSKFLVLKMIFEEIRNSPDDIFSDKMAKYTSMMEAARNRGALRIDFDNSGVIDDTTETADNFTRTLVRR